MLANGITPDEMMQVLNREVPSELEDLDLDKVLKPNYLGLPREGRRRCRCARWSWSARWRGSASSRRSTSASVSPRPCPPASTRAAGSTTTSPGVLADAGRDNDFRLLDRELYLTATDLDTCERIVFGEEGWSDVPISKAIECSTALPIVYKPVELKGRQMVDGGIRSTTNVDIAVEKGAKFIVVVNPLVPFVNDFEKTIPTVFGTPRAAGLRHGPAGDRQPDLPADRARPPAPVGRDVAGEIPRGRHRPDRARARATS